MRSIPAKTIISGYNDNNSWFGIHYNMNIYKGCCHGCIYCDSRSECYVVDNFDKVRYKENTLEIIQLELKSKSILGIVEKSINAGAKFIYPGLGVTLRSNQREWFYDKISEKSNHLANKYKDRYFCLYIK